MSTYLAMPKSSHAPLKVATGTSLKTLLQLATPSTTDIAVLAWGISFDAAPGALVPGVVSLVEVDVAATVTSLTPEKWGSAESPSSLCVGGTSATGYNASAEGSITASRLLDGQLIPPTTGYSLWFPKMHKVGASKFLRIRALFPADVNALPWILFDEPAM